MAWLFILIPILAVIALNLPFGVSYRKLAYPAALLLAVSQVLFVLLPPETVLASGACPLCPFLFRSLDALGKIMILSIGIVAFCSVIAGWHLTERAERKFDFANLIILAMAGMNGIILSGDLFTLYVFLEIVAVASFILIAMDKNKSSLEGAFKYLILSAVATILMLSSIAMIVMLTGGTTFADAAMVMRSGSNVPLGLFAAGLFLTGLLIKGGLVPFHGWLPDAYTAAPNGVSIFLAGIVTKTTGIYTIIKLVTAVTGFSGPVQKILLLFGALSAVAGAFGALSQKNFKRMLAYSSISQMGYIVLALGAANPIAIMGAAFHLFNHAIFKSQLFINAAAVEESTQTLDMDRLGGLAEKMPVTGATSLIAFLSTAGIPPLAGFWSKLLIIIGLWVAGFRVYAVIAVLTSVVTLAYFLSMQRRVFFGKLSAELSHITEANGPLTYTAVLLAIITIGAGIFFPFILNNLIIPVKAILG